VHIQRTKLYRGLNWIILKDKKPSDRTCISKHEKTMLVFKADKDMSTRLLRGYARSGHKLTPYLRSSENLRALKKKYARVPCQFGTRWRG